MDARFDSASGLWPSVNLNDFFFFKYNLLQ